MHDIESMSAEGFLMALAAPGRSTEIPEAADLYGWLVGGWALDVCHYGVDVRPRRLKAEAHFCWVLGGRAVQDVWVMAPDPELRMHGTTLRIWEPASEAWRVIWLDPATGRRSELIGNRSGVDIVQVGSHADGTPIRWIFSDIAADAFHWTGEALEPDGRTWRLEGEFHAKRIPRLAVGKSNPNGRAR